MNSSTPIVVPRAEWAAFVGRDATDPPDVASLAAAEVRELAGAGVRIDEAEVREVYAPLAALLRRRADATGALRAVPARSPGEKAGPSPTYVVGVVGGVAVGKSTAARVLAALLRRGPRSPRVDVLSTDGFLHPNARLEAEGLMARKGFPESYDTAGLVTFLQDVRTGKVATAPVYSHLAYDIVPDEEQVVDRPDVLVVEGLTLLQDSPGAGPAVRDLLDFSAYLDADPDVVERWFLDRLLGFRRTVFADEASYFHRFASFGDDELTDMGRQVWRQVNLVNLLEHIEPTRSRADLVLAKRADHAVTHVTVARRATRR